MFTWFLIIVCLPFLIVAVFSLLSAGQDFKSSLNYRSSAKNHVTEAWDEANKYVPYDDKDKRIEHERQIASHWQHAHSMRNQAYTNLTSSFVTLVVSVLCWSVVFWDWSYLKPFVLPYIQKILS